MPVRIFRVGKEANFDEMLPDSMIRPRVGSVNLCEIAVFSSVDRSVARVPGRAAVSGVISHEQTYGVPFSAGFGSVVRSGPQSEASGASPAFDLPRPTGSER